MEQATPDKLNIKTPVLSSFSTLPCHISLTFMKAIIVCKSVTISLSTLSSISSSGNKSRANIPSCERREEEDVELAFKMSSIFSLSKPFVHVRQKLHQTGKLAVKVEYKKVKVAKAVV